MDRESIESLVAKQLSEVKIKKDHKVLDLKEKQQEEERLEKDFEAYQKQTLEFGEILNAFYRLNHHFPEKSFFVSFLTIFLVTGIFLASPVGYIIGVYPLILGFLISTSVLLFSLIHQKQMMASFTEEWTVDQVLLKRDVFSERITLCLQKKVILMQKMEKLKREIEELGGMQKQLEEVIFLLKNQQFDEEMLKVPLKNYSNVLKLVRELSKKEEQ